MSTPSSRSGSLVSCFCKITGLDLHTHLPGYTSVLPVSEHLSQNDSDCAGMSDLLLPVSMPGRPVFGFSISQHIVVIHCRLRCVCCPFLAMSFHRCVQPENHQSPAQVPQDTLIFHIVPGIAELGPQRVLLPGWLHLEDSGFGESPYHLVQPYHFTDGQRKA